MNYILKRILGHGGMATVHLAEDPKFQTEVAVKVLNKEFIHNENIRKRFLAEARNMFRMSHPNIVRVTDLIEEEETVAFVMEYIDGETLKEYLERKGKLSAEEIKTIFSQMLEAVGYVHEQNLVHRDIKPSNFMIDKKGKVKLMDFGIAKNTDATSAEYTQTGTGMQMGTPMYMSPEQITETKSVTAQSDIYSLGVVLWQMVTGEKPYDVKTLSSFQLQLKIVQEPLRKTGTSWDHWIEKATSKSENDRFDSCSTWLRDLNQGNQNQPNANNSQDATLIQNTSQSDQTIIEKPNVSEILLEGSVFDEIEDLRYGKVDLKGNWIIQPVFDDLGVFDKEGYAHAEINGKWGYIDRKGNWIIQPVFDFTDDFDKEGYAHAVLDNKSGFIDRKGNWIIQPILDRLYYFGGFDNQGYAPMKINEKWGVIDRKGNWIIQPSFDNLFIFGDGEYVHVAINGKWGIIDPKGNWIIQPLFDNLGAFDGEGYANATINGKSGFIDRKGNWILQPGIFDNLLSFDCEGYAPAKINEKWGIIDRKGDWILRPFFDEIDVFDREGYASAKMNEKFGFIDRKGNWIIQPIFDEIEEDFDVDGYAKVRINLKWGYVNRKGNWTIEPNWLCEKDDNNYFKVSNDNKYGYKDVSNNWIIEPKFDYEITRYDSRFEDGIKIWNDDKKVWENIGGSSNTSYSGIDEETVEEYFSHLVGKQKVFLSNDLPLKKIKNFKSNFSEEFFNEGDILVYYDDTVWGKGDDGFMIYIKNEYVYLFFSVYGGVKYCVCFENDGVNSIIIECEFNNDGVQITGETQEDEEFIYGLGFNNDVGMTLVKFIQENTLY